MSRDHVLVLARWNRWRNCGFCNQGIAGNEGYECQVCKEFVLHKKCIYKDIKRHFCKGKSKVNYNSSEPIRESDGQTSPIIRTVNIQSIHFPSSQDTTRRIAVKYLAEVPRSKVRRLEPQITIVNVPTTSKERIEQTPPQTTSNSVNLDDALTEEKDLLIANDSRNDLSEIQATASTQTIQLSSGEITPKLDGEFKSLQEQLKGFDSRTLLAKSGEIHQEAVSPNKSHQSDDSPSSSPSAPSTPQQTSSFQASKSTGADGLTLTEQTKGMMRENVMKQLMDRHDLLKQDRKQKAVEPVETRKKAFSISAPSTATPITTRQEHSASVVELKDNPITQFSLAFARGDKRQVKKKILKLISKSSTRTVLFNATDQYGQNILHLAVDHCPELIKPIVEKKMDINKTDFRSTSPLALAAIKGDENSFMELLSLGAKPDQTVFHYFCSHFCSQNCEKILQTLIEKGIEIDTPPPKSTTGDKPIHSAVVNSRENVVEGLIGSVLMVDLLIKYGAKVNVTNNKGDTPLHWAVYTDKSKVAKFLLIAGADINAKGSEGLSPLDLAGRKPNSGVAICMRRVQEAIQILRPLDFHSEEPYGYILKKFIEGEVGETAFKGITYDILHAMGIKNPANIAVLLGAQEKLKWSETPEAKKDLSANEGVPQKQDKNVNSNLPFEQWFKTLPLSFDVDKQMQKKPITDSERVNEKKRLESRLDQFKLRRRMLAASDSEPDSNCLFLTVADQLLDSPDSSPELRADVAKWLSQNKDFKLGNGSTISSLVTNMDWSKYCASVEHITTWGDALMLLAIAENYGCKIFIISSIVGPSYAITINSSSQKTNRVVLLFNMYPLYFGGLDQVVEDPQFSDWNDFVIEFKDLKFIRQVGEGSTGEIYECLWKGTKVAAKKISESMLQKEDLGGFLGEIALLKRLRHPCIIQFIASCMHEGNLYIVTEFMNQGNLKTLIRTMPLSWEIKLNIATDIAQGMNYLHGLRPIVIHRDLKPSNILVDKSFNVKICDFGVAKLISDDQFLKTYCSTPAWTAPEIFNGSGYNEKVDIYSYGLILWELASCKQPFEEYSEQQIILGVSSGTLRPTISSECPSAIAALMKDCWNQDPKLRPTFEDIVVRLERIQRELFPHQAKGDESPGMERADSRKQPPKKHPSGHFWLIDHSELSYRTQDIIGSGRSAMVYRGTFRSQKVAIKVLKEAPEDGSFEKELEILSKIRSPNLIFFYGATLQPKCIIVTELMEKGSLFDYMQVPNKQMNWKDVIRFAKEIAQGIYFLHSWKPPVVHRDIKSSNLLLDKEDTIKICDLGLARFTTKSNDLTLRKCKGTPVYMAPESYWAALEVAEEEKGAVSTQNLGSELKSLLSEGNPFQQAGWSTKSDVFSYAIVLWEMVTRCYFGEYKVPYYSDNKGIKYDAAVIIQVAKKGLRPSMRPEIPAPFQTLITKCWAQEPQKRPDLDVVIQMLDSIQKDYEQNKSTWNKAYIFNTR